MPLAFLLKYFQFLNCSHFIDNPLEDPSDGVGTKRACVMPEHVRVHLVFALRLVNGHPQGLFNTANLFHDGSTVIQKLKNLPVDLIDPLAAFT
jgi:hypothetical protein